MIIGKNYYEESQKLFSTGNEDLDDILEEVYYSGIEDGYDYAQREFAEKSKLNWGTKMDLKIINRNNKKYDGNWVDNIKQYKKALKDPNLSEKQKGILTNLIDKEKLAAGKMTEEEYISKYPKAAKKKYRDKTFSEDYTQKDFSKKDKDDKNDIERAGKIVTKAGVVTAGLGAASALGGAKLVNISAKKAAEAATDNALRKSVATGAIGGAAAGAGAKATKAGLGLAAIGVGTKIVGRRVRKQREKEAAKKEEKK